MSWTGRLTSTAQFWGRGCCHLTAFMLQVDELSEVADKYSTTLEENRRLYNEVQDLKGNIRVFCRIRPSGCTGSADHSCVDAGVEGEVSRVSSDAVHRGAGLCMVGCSAARPQPGRPRLWGGGTVELFLLLGLHSRPVRTLAWGNGHLSHSCCTGSSTPQCQGAHAHQPGPLIALASLPAAGILAWRQRSLESSVPPSRVRGPACGASVPVCNSWLHGQPSCGCMYAGVGMEWKVNSAAMQRDFGECQQSECHAVQIYLKYLPVAACPDCGCAGGHLQPAQPHPQTVQV